MTPLLNPRLFNPLYWHIKPLLQDPAIRYIFVEGGSSAAKTYTISQALTIDGMEHNYSSLVFRRFHVNIKDTIKKTFSAGMKKIGLAPYWKEIQDEFKCEENKQVIRFKGLDDEENIKGVEDFNVVYNNEWSQFTKPQWDQQRKRLRGRPNQKFICDWNPISSKLWIYEEWIDKDEWTDLPLTIEAPTIYSALDPVHSFKRINKAGNAIWIKTTFRDNYWITGHPSGQGGYKDEHTLADYEYDRIHNPNLYRVYANGERGIIRTGGEFLKQFNELKHVRPVALEKAPLHISLDSNVKPYVTVSIWQINVEGKKIRQVFEIPCKSPDNSAPKAADKLVKWLNAIGHEDVVYVYGDPSGRARTTVDADNRSFFDKFIEVLTKANVRTISRVQRSAPEVAMSANFINAIFEHNLNGWAIEIGDNCKVSIDDYSSVKEDKDGGMLKPKVKDKETGETYEPNGHFTDAFRYFVIALLFSEFLVYKARGKRTGSIAGTRG